MLLGVILVVISVAGGLLFWGSAQETTPVLVAARDIARGHIIQREDVTVTRVRLEGRTSSLAISEARMDSVTGHAASRVIYAGEIVVSQDVTSGPVIGPNDVAVTLPVKADAAYSGLRPGDAVAVLATRNKGKPESQTTTLLDRAVIYDVSLEPGRVTIGRTGDGQQQERGLTNVTLVVPRSEAERVGHAVVNWDLTVALLSPSQAGPGAAAR